MAKIKNSLALSLKLDEYVDTWCSVIEDFYRQIVSDDKVFLPLTETKEAEYKLSYEIRTVLLLLAMKMFKSTSMNERAKLTVEDKVVDGVYRVIVPEDEEVLEQSKEYYRNRYEMFEEVDVYSSNDSKKEAKQAVRDDMIGYARYVISNVTDKPEADLKDTITALSVHLMKAANTFAYFSNNTTLDGNGLLLRRYKFYVKR